LISGYLHYALKDYERALDDYNQAQIINPESVCFSLIYISDCLYELRRMNELNNYLIEAKHHITHFSSLHTEVLDFFKIIWGTQNPNDEAGQFKALFTSLSQLNSESPYVRIIRKHLLNYAKKNHKYKLIFDYETMMLDNT
jgi:tetratricopeptide (TPR) repeat protein